MPNEMKKLISLLSLALFLAGCAAPTYWTKLQAIDKAETKGKISSKEAFQLRNELYKEYRDQSQ
jgi:PBP1b-binding outer membrane lipoprotein LpoB